jgi:hypothetical protein
MPAMISSSNLTIEKTFRRLLLSTERLIEEKSIEDWKVRQVMDNRKNKIFYFKFLLL